MSALRLVPGLLAVACTGAPEPAPPVADEEPVAEAPAWTAAEVGEQLEAALAEGIPEPWTLRAHYLDLVRRGDDVCPGPNENLQMPEHSCETDDGYTFYGVATWWDTSTAELESWNMFTASFVITPPDGAPFRGGGSFAYEELADGTWTGVVEGVFVDADEAAWLGSEVSTALDLAGAVGDDTLALHGGITVGERVVWFEDVRTGGACGGAAGGLGVRHPGGAWYTVDFGADCATCGAVSLDGSALGEVCVDLAAPFAAVQAARTAR